MHPLLPTEGTLVLFCRRPQPGVGKQRVAARLGAGFAAGLGQRLLAAALEDAADWPGPVVIAPAEAGDAPWARGLLARESQVLPQPGGNLGERLAGIDRALRAAGHHRLFYIGSDAPGLTPELYARARAALDQADAVLAGARDGGVTLMGSSRPWPALHDLPWSSPALGQALRQRLEQAGFRPCWLDGGSDVDEVEDLPGVVADLAGDARPARQALRDWLLAHAPPLLPAAGRLSVVIPVFRDNAALAELLAWLQHPAAPLEVIVVDGADDPGCRALCDRAGARWLATRPGRGHQLDAGARLARGEWLWFLHADSAPPAQGPALVGAALAEAGVAGGWFRFRFRGPDRPGRRLLAGLINWRARFGMAYGDQGLFMRRADYLAAGGFPDVPLFEEVPLLRALRRRGRLVRLDAAIGVSPRRWERDGWLYRSLANRALALAYMLGVPPARLAAWYGYTGHAGDRDE